MLSAENGRSAAIFNLELALRTPERCLAAHQKATVFLWLAVWV
jgi:hypothetical protein